MLWHLSKGGGSVPSRRETSLAPGMAWDTHRDAPGRVGSTWTTEQLVP